MCDSLATPRTGAHQAPLSMGLYPGSSIHRIFLARILEWVFHSLLQDIFPAQGSNLHPLRYSRLFTDDSLCYTVEICLNKFLQGKQFHSVQLLSHVRLFATP